MCGRYIVVSDQEKIEKTFRAKASKAILQQFNISPGKFAPVITNDKPHEIQFFRFGLTPFWSKKQMTLFNARAEGDGNKENDPDYTGGKGIVTKPSFRKPIRSQRCLVIADAFIEGTTNEGLDKPFLIYLEDRKPFAMAGIWDTWVNPDTKEEIHGFAIITVPPNELLAHLPHHRCPVILNKKDEENWLRETHLGNVTKYLYTPPVDNMNAYRISPKIKNQNNYCRELIDPIGEKVKTVIEPPAPPPNTPFKERFLKFKDNRPYQEIRKDSEGK